ncbi:hypothetical protein HYALB_00012484 [Hymenoscyphus albidus]|uniref:ribonuclease H n=1 Tax=Hymenoscyphus albidus TaxID=595503 RepID=A0A9N9LND1_9HELO|nr:hypothetical protein HYALB_00012484 [Hymenoscyphus albidus]
MSRLANNSKGLTPFALRQLYTACVTSIADYGSTIWWRGQAQFTTLLQKLQNLAIRKILGVFKTTPILPMEVESALPPPEVRLSSSLRTYALRLLKLAPSHPVNHATNKLLNTQITPGKKKPTTPQLQRIHSSISNLYDLENLEQISHFYFPPWERQTPYKVHISKLSKEEEAKVHLRLLQNNPNNSIFIYTDASSTATENSQGIGVGLSVISPQSSIIHYEKKINIGPNKLVYNGEVEGATLAVEYAAKHARPGIHFHIYSDNQAGLWRLKTTSDHPGQDCQIRAIKAARKVASKGANTTIHWVPGHTDIPGNEKADKLAKAATTIQPSTQLTSFAMLGVKIRQIQNKEWHQKLTTHPAHHTEPSTNQHSYRREFPWKILSKPRVPQGTKREIASAFYQLKLGHGYFKSYLHNLGHTNNNRCRCGRQETPTHLLLSCPETGDARKVLKRNLLKHYIREFTMKSLLHTTKGVEATLDFLRTTKIATRIWHTQRVAEEEKEEEDEEEDEEE